MKAALDQVVRYRVYENQKIIQFMHGNLFDFLGQSFCSSPSTKEFRGVVVIHLPLMFYC